MDDVRYRVFCQILELMDNAYDLMLEYDSFPHKYGDDTLYQAESHIIEAIGRRPGITVTDLANLTGKTSSACSQLVRKLREKGWVAQTRNAENNREYNLSLTDHGWVIFQNHEQFDRACHERSCRQLERFTEEQLQIYMDIQQQINEGFRQDVENSKLHFSEITQK